jgi:hypothetical protein
MRLPKNGRDVIETGKLFERTALDLKLNAQVIFTMLYLGARAVISRHITKSTIISMMIESACSSRPFLLYDDTAKSYTVEDLRKKGEDLVDEAFNTLMKKRDTEFVRAFGELNLPDDIDQDELLRLFATQILAKSFSMINLRDIDIENIVSAILINEDDLRYGKEGKDGMGSYIFLKEYEPFVRYKEVRALLKRYRALLDTKEALLLIHGLFKATVEHVMQISGWTSQEPTGHDYYEHYDANMDFLQVFSKGLQELDFNAIAAEAEFKNIYKTYFDLLLYSGKLESMRRCGDCNPCIYDKRKCLDKWLKSYMKELLIKLCFVDIFKGMQLETFEEWIFSQTYPTRLNFIKGRISSEA